MKTKKIVTFGELLLRFSKDHHQRLTQGDYFSSKYGGSEANVAVSLATLGDQVEYVTRLPQTPTVVIPQAPCPNCRKTTKTQLKSNKK